MTPSLTRMVVTMSVVLNRLSDILEEKILLSMLSPSETCQWPIWRDKQHNKGFYRANYCARPPYGSGE